MEWLIAIAAFFILFALLKYLIYIAKSASSVLNEKRVVLRDIRKEKRSLEAQKQDLIMQERRLKDLDCQYRSALQQLEETQDQSYPWLAKLRADAYEAADLQWVEYLRCKNRPALQTAAEVEKIIRYELKTSRIEAKQAEYQLCFYESLFPWLKDFKEVPPNYAFSFVKNDAHDSNDDSQSYFKNYISPIEWNNLSESDRYQLILDRYITRSKSNWEIGIEYERYIGYLCEQEGYKVIYNGAREKLEDMGRDLILKRNGETILVQCKRWAEYKTVHENHVFQLAGSVFEYQYQHPGETITGALVTAAELSDVASRCAGYLGIKVYAKVPCKGYRRIKCNIGKGGQKIYHLPVDQQYDTAVIDSPGEFYASTVAEAEAAGFRRAYRWHSNTSNSK